MLIDFSSVLCSVCCSLSRWLSLGYQWDTYLHVAAHLTLKSTKTEDNKIYSCQFEKKKFHLYYVIVENLMSREQTVRIQMRGIIMSSGSMLFWGIFFF